MSLVTKKKDLFTPIYYEHTAVSLKHLITRTNTSQNSLHIIRAINCIVIVRVILIPNKKKTLKVHVSDYCSATNNYFFPLQNFLLTSLLDFSSKRNYNFS